MPVVETGTEHDHTATDEEVIMNRNDDFSDSDEDPEFQADQKNKLFEWIVKADF